MSLGIVCIVLFAALLHASWNTMVKGGGNKLFEVTLLAMASSTLCLCAIPFLPLPAPAAWPLLALSSVIHFTYNVCIAAAYTRVDLSFGYTIMRGCAPLFTAMAMLLLGSPLSPGGWGGVLLLCCGVLTLTWDTMHVSRARPSDLAIIFGTAVVIMGYTLADGYGARVSGHAVSYACWIFFIEAFPLMAFVFLRHRKAFLPYARARLRVAPFSGLCNVGSYGIAIWAMTKAPIALVAALRETSVIFGMLLSILILKEPFTPARLIAVLLVASGTMLIRLA